MLAIVSALGAACAGDGADTDVTPNLAASAAGMTGTAGMMPGTPTRMQGGAQAPSQMPTGTAGTMAGAGTAGTMADPGAAGTMADPGAAGMMADPGAAGMMAGTAGMGPMGTGTCCADGNCICREPVPSALTTETGPYETSSYRLDVGTVHFPVDAEPPFAAVAICGGFLNTGPEMASWGPFYASYGIVTVITTTSGSDSPQIRATKLIAAVEALKAENTNGSSMLMGKLADRYGTSGYSMGGGGTTIAASMDKTLMTSVGLAPFGGTGAEVVTPSLLLCGTADTTAPCSMATGDYEAIPETTPKMVVRISGGSHLSGWFGPTGADRGASGEAALAFQKLFLEGDERWKPLLLQARGMVTTNIQ